MTERSFPLYDLEEYRDCKHINLVNWETAIYCKDCEIKIINLLELPEHSPLHRKSIAELKAEAERKKHAWGDRRRVQAQDRQDQQGFQG